MITDKNDDFSWFREWADRAHGWRLGRRAVWRLRGPDAVRYANGQLTRDVEAVQEGQCALSCVTNAKGQFQFLVGVMRMDDDVLIDGEAEFSDELEARLGRYLISDDAELEPATDWGDQILFHVITPASRPLDSGQLPPEVQIARSDRMGTPGWDLWTREEGEGVLVEWLETLGAEVGDAVEDRRALAGDEPPRSVSSFARILLAMPRAGLELTDKTLPPEAGLDRWAVDYRKGCYIGQEVLSRLFSVGRVKRKLVRLAAPVDAVVHVGDPVADPVDPGRAVGEITSAAVHPRLDRLAALAYVKGIRDDLDAVTTIVKDDEPAVVLHRIPEHLTFS